MNDDWDVPASILFHMMPDGCEELTATVVLDYGYSEMRISSLGADGRREWISPDENAVTDLSSSLLRLRDELSEKNGGQKIDGCELVIRSDKTFRYKLNYATS